MRVGSIATRPARQCTPSAPLVCICLTVQPTNALPQPAPLRKFPKLLELVADGRLHLTGIGLLASHLTAENAEELMAAATHKSKRDIEQFIAARAPKPDAPGRVTKLPEPKLRNESQVIAEV